MCAPRRTSQRAGAGAGVRLVTGESARCHVTVANERS